MKKIPTLFQREFANHKVVKVLPELSNTLLSWVLAGDGIATEKIDGACCAVIDDKFYKRYDAKKDKLGVMKQPPEGAIPCCPPDPVTGHWPHWIPVDEANPADQWFIAAFQNSGSNYPDGTYEAVGSHFNGNPYCLDRDYAIAHGNTVIALPDRSYEGIRSYLADHCIEGIVFWKDGQPQCKIKRSDFGLPWPDKERQKHLMYYAYEIEAPEKYADILRKIASSEHMTVDEMLVLGLRHIAAHPEVLSKWEAELNALPDEIKEDFSRICLRNITPVYRDSIWLAKHAGGAK